MVGRVQYIEKHNCREEEEGAQINIVVGQSIKVGLRRSQIAWR